MTSISLPLFLEFIVALGQVPMRAQIDALRILSINNSPQYSRLAVLVIKNKGKGFACVFRGNLL